MNKSTIQLLRTALQFEKKLLSFADNPQSEEILQLQRSITDLLGRDIQAKEVVDKQLKTMVAIGTTSKPGTPWTPGPQPNDEDGYLGERTKVAVYILSKLSNGQIPNVGTAPIADIINAVNKYQPNASYPPAQ